MAAMSPPMPSSMDALWQAEAEAKVQEGIDALARGDATEMTSEDWQRLKKELVERHKKSHKQ
jgi:hypothetical protein